MDRRAFLAALAAGAALPSLAPAQPVMRRTHMAMAPVRLTGAPAEVAMTPWRSMPGVQVTVNGAGPFTFGIDTGFPGAVIFSDQVAQAAQLSATGQDMMSDPSGLNPVRTNRYRVPRMTIGPMTLEDVPAGALPPMPNNTGAPLEGVIGMALFGAYTLTLDYPGRRVAVSEAALPATDGRTVFDYERGNLIELTLSVGERPMRAHLDTGQVRMPLIVPQDAVAGLATHGEPRSIGVAHTVSQAFPLFAVALDSPVRLGAVSFAVPEVAYPAPIGMANLGSMALQSLVLKLDGRTGRVQFVTPG